MIQPEVSISHQTFKMSLAYLVSLKEKLIISANSVKSDQVLFLLYDHWGFWIWIWGIGDKDLKALEIGPWRIVTESAPKTIQSIIRNVRL